MSRRPAPSAAQERAAQNQQTIKSLLKLDANKSCADCKRNKHPRWASWNLGIFICIRCSGIHRGMGTHISRVKSVDLDAWTDEQLQSVLRWGNTRSNKYWEAKLAPGHVPSEAKIENFIRTKYETKRWVMDGPMPDPATLADDDEVPLNVVQEKAKLERASSKRQNNVSTRAAPQIDLFGDVPSPPPRPSTTDVPAARPAPPPQAGTAAKSNKPSDTLLGLDFFGGPSNVGNVQGSASPANPAPRADVKQSILSLYATAPKATPQEPQSSASTAQKSSAFGGLDDAFGSLSVNSTTSPPPNAGPFAGFNSSTTQRSAAAAPQTAASAGGGGFFDTGSKAFSQPPPQSKSASKPHANLIPQTHNDFGDFSFVSGPASNTSTSATKPTYSASNDLFDMDDPPMTTSTTSAPPPKPINQPTLSSVFDLSQRIAPVPSPPKATPPTKAPPTNATSFAAHDAWGSDNAWATPDPTPASEVPPKPQPGPVPSAAPAPSSSMGGDFGAWGSSDISSEPSVFGNGHAAAHTSHAAPPKVAPDEDFGGWSSNAPVTPAAPAPEAAPVSQPHPPSGGGGFGGSGGGGGGGEDLFDNVWG